MKFSQVDAKNTARHPLVGLLLAVVVLVLAAWPPLAALFEEGMGGAFKYLASDSFYYLAIADRSSSAGYYTFDGLNPTSGFHPLWEFYLRSGFGVLGLDSEQQILFTSISGVGFTAIGAVLFAWAVFGLTGRFAVALLASVPGFLFFFLPHFGMRFASNWSFSNGMESPLSAFFFGLTLLFLFSGRRVKEVWRYGDWLQLSVLLTALILTRLDDVFILVPFGLYAFLSGDSLKEKVVRGAAVSLVPVFAVVAYMGFNFAYTGTFLPSSGVAKAAPLWAVVRNSYAVFTTLFPFWDFMRPEIGVWTSEGWRVTQMLVPAMLAAYWLARTRSVSRLGARLLTVSSNATKMVSCLAFYVVLKAAYNFTTVGIWDQGSWYYVASIMACNLILALLFTELLERSRNLQGEASKRGWLSRNEQWISSLAAVFLVLVVANSEVDAKRNGRDQERNYRFWSQRTEAQEWLKEHCQTCGVVSFDDGIVAYSLDGVATLNGLGLVMDGEAEVARNNGRLLELAWERGYRLLVSVNYPMVDPEYERPEQLRSHLARNRHFEGQSLDQWHFEVAFRMPQSNVNFICFAPEASAQSPDDKVRDRCRSGGQFVPHGHRSMVGS